MHENGAVKSERSRQPPFRPGSRAGGAVSREREMVGRAAGAHRHGLQACRSVEATRKYGILWTWHRHPCAPPRGGPLPKPGCLRIFALSSGGSVLTMLSPVEAHSEIPDLNAAELGAIAHLYRGEIYRSTIWRTRLDNTTNWSIVTMGIALSTTFSSKEASGLPLILIGMLLAVFLGLEARRYRYFNVWRARARYMETHLYAHILSGKREDPGWRVILAQDYLHPRHHISFFRAAGRRVRRTYIWIIAIQTSAYFGKLAIHPQMATHFNEFVERAEIGPIPGWVVLLCGLLYNLGWVFLAVATWWLDRRAHVGRTSAAAMG
jgi:uncharacterized membrane protein